MEENKNTEFEEYITFKITTSTGEEMELAVIDEFEFENKNNETTFDIDDKGNLSMSKKISISSEMEKTIFNLISSMPITVEVHKGYVAFNRIDFTVYDTGIINSIAYVFQGMENVDTGYERIEIAPNWYYQYGEFFKGIL
mgnify:CR=1 FL=1